MSDFARTAKTKIKRRPDRGYYDKKTIYEIIDAAKFCHIAFVQDGQPFVIPALHARRADELLIHGSSASRLLKHIANGNPLSISIAILDALIFAKTAFNQSINFRSVVLFGKGRLIEEEKEKLDALECLTNGLFPGTWDAVRKPTKNEIKATSIVAVKIEAASAKIRNAPPGDDGADRDLPLWAGILPVKQVIGEPIPAEYTDKNQPLPDYVLQHISKSEHTK